MNNMTKSQETILRHLVKFGMAELNTQRKMCAAKQLQQIGVVDIHHHPTLNADCAFMKNHIFQPPL